MKKSISYEIVGAKIDIAFNDYSNISFVMDNEEGFKINNTSIIEFLKATVATVTYIPQDGMMRFYRRRSLVPTAREFNMLDEMCVFGPTEELTNLIAPYKRQSDLFNDGKPFHNVEKKEVIESMVDTIFDLID